MKYSPKQQFAWKAFHNSSIPFRSVYTPGTRRVKSFGGNRKQSRHRKTETTCRRMPNKDYHIENPGGQSRQKTRLQFERAQAGWILEAMDRLF